MIYTNDQIGIRFDIPETMEIAWFETIKNWRNAQCDFFQRHYNDLPKANKDYRILFEANELESGCLIIREVTCMIYCTNDNDSEIRETYSERWTEEKEYQTEDFSFIRFTNDKTPLSHWFSQPFGPFRVWIHYRWREIQQYEDLVKRTSFYEPRLLKDASSIANTIFI